MKKKIRDLLEEALKISRSGLPYIGNGTLLDQHCGKLKEIEQLLNELLAKEKSEWQKH